MADNHPGDDGQNNVSMSGVLALLCGCGCLLAYWKFDRLAESLSRTERLIFIGVTSFVALWGLKQVIDARWPGRRRRKKRKLARRSNGHPERGAIASISWGGILLILIGAELLLTIRLWVPTGGAALLVLLAGVVCLVQGMRRILATLLPGRFAPRPQYRVALPKPGQMYLLVMTVLLVGSLLGHSNMLMLVFAMMVGPFVLNGWITYSMLKRTSVSRRLPKSAIAGEPFTVDVTLENRKLLLASTVMVVTDQIENDVEELAANVLFARVPARSSRTDAYRVRLMQRGVYRFGPLHLATRFPLGIVERRLIFDGYDVLLVYPHVGRLTEAWRRGRLLTAEVVDQQMMSRGTFHDEFHGMRDYRPGDSPRSIHWRTSVRRNELTVREHEQNRSHDLMLLLDLWQPAAPGDADRERLELAVSFAATLAVDHVRRTRDARLEVVVAGYEFTHWGGRTGAAGINSLLEMLALAAAGSQPDVPKLAAEAETRRTASMRILVLTTRRSQADFLNAIRPQAGGGAGSTLPGTAEVIAVGPAELAPYFIIDTGGNDAQAGRSRENNGPSRDDAAPTAPAPRFAAGLDGVTSGDTRPPDNGSAAVSPADRQRRQVEGRHV